MWELVIVLIIVVLLNSTTSQLSDCITCTDGNAAPYYITQPSTNDHVLVVSPDVAVVTLMCSLNVTIPAGMTITWTHNDSVVLTVTTQAEQTSSTVTLQRGGAKPSYAGLYQCVFDDNAGHVLRRNITLLVIFTPKIIQPPADFHRVTFDELTSSIRLMCSLNDTISSSVTVVWTHNGNTVMATRHKEVTQAGNTTTLQIRNPRPKDAGDYKCVFNGLNLQRIILLEFQNSGTTSTPTFDISLTVNTNDMATTTSHSITESADHSTSSISSTVTTSTTNTTTIVSTSDSLSIATTATSTNTNTMFINSPTLVTSQSDNSIDFSSVGVIAVIAALVVVGFVIVAVVMVGSIVVYRKRKKSKQYNKRDDVHSNSTDGATLQRFSMCTPEPVNNKIIGQDSKDPQYVNIPEGIQPTKQEATAPDNVYSIPHCHIEMEPNPAYITASSGTIRLSEVKYY